MPPTRAHRNTLDRDLVLSSALVLADRDGLDALTIRGLAAELKVRPMAIYHYVASKDELLDALVDLVFGEVYFPTKQDWRRELFQRSTSMRETLDRHPWALPIVDTRSRPGPAMLANHEAVLDVLRRSGFSLQATAHAYAVLDAYVYGFALMEGMLDKAGLPDSTPDELENMALARFPRVNELATMYVSASTYPLLSSFDVGLNLVLDGIGRFTELFPEGKDPHDN